MCVDLSDYNRYLNQNGTEHKYHTINTPEWPNSHKLKIQNVNNTGVDTDIYTKFYGKMHHIHAVMTTWPKVETVS